MKKNFLAGLSGALALISTIGLNSASAGNLNLNCHVGYQEEIPVYSGNETESNKTTLIDYYTSCSLDTVAFPEMKDIAQSDCYKYKNHHYKENQGITGMDGHIAGLQRCNIYYESLIQECNGDASLSCKDKVWEDFTAKIDSEVIKYTQDYRERRYFLDLGFLILNSYNSELAGTDEDSPFAGQIRFTHAPKALQLEEVDDARFAYSMKARVDSTGRVTMGVGPTYQWLRSGIVDLRKETFNSAPTRSRKVQLNLSPLVAFGGERDARIGAGADFLLTSKGIIGISAGVDVYNDGEFIISGGLEIPFELSKKPLYRSRNDMKSKR